MRFSIFTIISIIGIISNWAEKALSDGKITLAEGLQLLSDLGAGLGLDLEFDISEQMTGLTAEEERFLDEPDADVIPNSSQYEKPEE